MKVIKTDRLWYLRMKRSGDCVEIAEKHNEQKLLFAPCTVIPIEAVNEVIEFLQEFKRKVKHEES